MFIVLYIDYFLFPQPTEIFFGLLAVSDNTIGNYSTSPARISLLGQCLSARDLPQSRPRS